MRFYYIAVFLFIHLRLWALGPDAEVLKRETTITVKHKQLIKSEFICIKINNPDGDKYANISIGYTDNNPVSDLDAWLEDVNGKHIKDLEKKEIDVHSEIAPFTLFEDSYVKQFQLKHNVYPYVIKYKYTQKTEDFFYLCHWSPIVDENLVTDDARLTLDLPADYKVAMHNNLMPEPVIDNKESRTVYVWQCKYDKILHAETLCTPLGELLPNIIIVPVDFTYGTPGSQKDWISFGNWYSSLIKGLDVLPKSEAEVVKKSIEGITDKKLIVRKLYQYLQDNTSYVSVQMGIGAVKCFPASYVSEKKYGDCKGLANYMKALLNVAGIASDIVLIHADGSQDAGRMINDFPSSQFNHAILMVPLDNDSVWLDCTSHINPAGYLGSFTQNRYALVVQENNSRIIKTPAFTPDNSYTFSRNLVRIDTSGNSFVEGKDVFKGEPFELYKSLKASVNSAEVKNVLYFQMPYHDFEIKKYNIQCNSRDSDIAHLSYSILVKSNVQVSAKSYSYRMDGMKSKTFESPSKRHLGVRISYPDRYVDTTEVIVPAHTHWKANKPTDINNKYGLLKVHFILNKDRVMVCREFILKNGDYSIDEYKAFYDFIDMSKRELYPALIFTKDE